MENHIFESLLQTSTPTDVSDRAGHAIIYIIALLSPQVNLAERMRYAGQTAENVRRFRAFIQDPEGLAHSRAI